jgi:hypothetical protein
MTDDPARGLANARPCLDEERPWVSGSVPPTKEGRAL